MAAHLRALLLLAAAFTADAVVVDTTAALRAAVDRQEATIRLGADLSLGGEPLIITADCDLRGNGYALFQGPGARHMHVNGTVALAITDLTLALVDAVGLRRNDTNYTWPTAGGIDVRGGNLTARDVSFEGLSASEEGGAVYARDGHTILERCSFEDTSAGISGGAVFQEGGSLIVKDCTFSRTRAVVNGGAIAAADVDLTVRGSTFVESAVVGGYPRFPGINLGSTSGKYSSSLSPTSGGGAVWLTCPRETTKTRLHVVDSRFIRCSTVTGTHGGAVRAVARGILISGSTFEANRGGPEKHPRGGGSAVWLSGTPIDSESGGTDDVQVVDDSVGLPFLFGNSLVIRRCAFTGNFDWHEVIDVKSFDHFVVNRVKVVGNEATAILRMSKIVNSLFTHNHFAHNTGLAIRAFQLFSAAAVNKGDGSFVLDDTNFTHNTAPFSDDGGALFVKESPGKPVQILRSFFVNNSAPLTRGGALNLQAETFIFECLFEDNSAKEGGAIYVGTDGRLDSTWNDFMGNRASEAGGAISACARDRDTTCYGTMSIFQTRAFNNSVDLPDSERGGGGFLKSNGADVQLREVIFGGSTAAGKPSSIGLRFGINQIHQTKLLDNGTITLANDGTLDVFCSPSITPSTIKKVDDENFAGWMYHDNPDECSLCQAGHEWIGIKSECVKCEPGFFKPANQTLGTKCEPCSGKRKFQSHPGSASCERCSKTKRANRHHTGCREKKTNEVLIFEIVFGTIGGLMGLFIVFLLVKKGRKEYVEKRKLESERAVVVKQQVAEALSRVREFRSQLCVLAGDVFVELGELVSHEELLDRGHLIIVPTVARLNSAKNSGDVFVFISHQWLDYKTPDPENVHYDAMVSVVRAVAEDAMTSLDRIRVWVDYVSIPQENRFTQRAAISSLPTFASSCDYFVVVAPESTHHGACTPCNSRTYRRRVWCRAEIMSCWARNGSSDMYFWSGSRGLKRLTGESGDEILLEALDVFNGDLTCCRLKHPHGDPCDREELMLPMLGLFAELYRGRDSHTREAYALIEPLVDRLYPRTFTYHRGDGHPDETHPLFGDLVDAVRHAIDTEADARSSGDGSPLGSFDGRNYFPGTHARRHASTKSVAGSLSSIQSRKSLRLPSLISRRTESPATIKARACDERGRLTSRSTSGTNSGTGDSRTSRKLVNFRTLTWQSSQGESKEDSTGPPTF